MPQDEVEKQGQRSGRAPVGTGPFKFVRWTPHQEIVLEANDQYYEGRPFLDTVVFKIFSGAKLEETFAEFLKDIWKRRLFRAVRPTRYTLTRRISSIKRLTKPMLNLIYIGFNTRLSPLTIGGARRSAVNTVAIVKDITKRGSGGRRGSLPPAPALIPACGAI